MRASGHILHLSISVLVAALIPVLSSNASPQDAVPEGLDATPIVNDAVGLRMNPPAGAQVTPTQIGSDVMISIREDADFSRWSLEVVPMVNATARVEVDQMFDAILARIRAAATRPEILSDEKVTYAGRTGRMVFYRDTAEGSLGYTAGLMMLPTGESRFMSFRMGFVPGHYEQMRPIFERAFETIELYSEEEVGQLREMQRLRAEKVLATFAEDRLRSLVGKSQWFRVYRPDPGGDFMQDTEVAYVRLQVSEAPRGALTPERDPANYTAEESESGFFVQLDARYIIDLSTGRHVDATNGFWMAWDRSEEAWSMRATQHVSDRTFTEAETGLRTPAVVGTPYGRLFVIYQQAQQYDREEFKWVIPDEPYLSQAEVYLLGNLLPRDGSIAGEMGFRYYEPTMRETTILPTRIDTWEPIEDGSGNWRLSSQLINGTPPIESVFSRDGDLIRRTKSDGSVTEPITLEQLKRIWQAKGLPTR